MLQVVRSVPTEPREKNAAALLRMLDAWRTQLQRRRFAAKRIDRDLKAVAHCADALGPPAGWHARALQRHFATCKRKARGLEAPALDELAVRRFWAFHTAPAEGELLSELLAAWWERLVGAGCKADTASAYRDKVLHFIDRAGALWRATLRSMDRFSAERLESHAARETLRKDQLAVKRFIDFITDPAEEDWVGRILAVTGCQQHQICTPGNTLPHVRSCPEGVISRCLTDRELQTFFAYLRARIAGAFRQGRKGYWTARRDYALFQFMLATGARNSDLEGLREVDLTRAHSGIAEFSAYEQVHFVGKAPPRGPPKVRDVPAIALCASQWAEFDRYMREVRPHLLHSETSSFVFPSEKGDALDANAISHLFSQYRDEAGLPKDLHAHCMRHSFAQRLLESGVELAIIQALLGHDQPSTTTRYAKVLQPYIKERLLECAKRQRRESDAQG